MGRSWAPFSSLVEGVRRGCSKRWLNRMPAGRRMPEMAAPCLVVPPGGTGEVAADHHLHGNHAAFRGADGPGRYLLPHVVGDDVLRGVEPEQRQGVEDLSLAGYRGEHPVESRNAVRGGDEHLRAQVHDVPHLAAGKQARGGSVRRSRQEPSRPSAPRRSRLQLVPGPDDAREQAVADRLFRIHPVVAVGVLLHFFDGLPRLIRDQPVDLGAQLLDLLCMDLDLRGDTRGCRSWAGG